MSDDVRNTPNEYDTHAMYLAAVKRRTRPRTRTLPTPRKLAMARATLYALRRAEIADAYWAGMRDEIRRDTMADIADDIRREFGDR